MKTVYLFDIDSVLVAPHGYRAAVTATLAHFARPLGIPERLLPREADMELLEAMRVTSEWDMVPISLLAMLDRWLERADHLETPENLKGFAQLDFPDGIDHIDYARQLGPLGAAVQPGVFPSETALELSRRGLLFPHLQASPLLEALLKDTRRVERSMTTRAFQHFSLGSRAFESVYGMRAEFEIDSLLLSEDIPLLDIALRDEILDRVETGRLNVAAYTQRPSGPPREAPAGLRGYAPEAEFALELAGLADMPLISYGRMRYLAELHAVEPEGLLKPSPVQALAAIGAALLKAELPALENAYELTQAAEGKNDAVLPEWACEPLEVHVFEDSAGGIEAVQRAGELLGAAGANVDVYAWGIATNPAKVQALARVGSSIYGTTNEAINEALGITRLSSAG